MKPHSLLSKSIGATLRDNDYLLRHLLKQCRQAQPAQPVQPMTKAEQAREVLLRG